MKKDDSNHNASLIIPHVLISPQRRMLRHPLEKDRFLPAPFELRCHLNTCTYHLIMSDGIQSLSLSQSDPFGIRAIPRAPGDHLGSANASRPEAESHSCRVLRGYLADLSQFLGGLGQLGKHQIQVFRRYLPKQCRLIGLVSPLLHNALPCLHHLDPSLSFE